LPLGFIRVATTHKQLKTMTFGIIGTLVIVTSDHGMAELSEERVIFLDDLINLEDVDIIDRTPVAMIRPDEGKTDDIYQALKGNEENYSVYLKKNLPEEYRFKNHYRIPEIIMIADISYTITSLPFYQQRGIIAGTHGFDNMEPEMLTFFAAAGPDFIRGETAEGFESIHIYELMSRILGITPAPNNGSLDEVKHLLRRE
jgi:predicted AlkP superfamily pyrophosphatase or phosphodiesterase